MNKNTNKRINEIISDGEKFIESTQRDTIETKWEERPFRGGIYVEEPDWGEHSRQRKQPEDPVCHA